MKRRMTKDGVVRAAAQGRSAGVTRREFVQSSALVAGMGVWDVRGTEGTYFFYSNGQPAEVQPYRNGIMHGVGTQWAEDGRVLVSWTLVNGVGFDIWCDNTTEKLSEEAYWPREGEVGYSRQWNGDDKTIWDEYYFRKRSGYSEVGKGTIERRFGECRWHSIYCEPCASPCATGYGKYGPTL